MAQDWLNKYKYYAQLGITAPPLFDVRNQPESTRTNLSRNVQNRIAAEQLAIQGQYPQPTFVGPATTPINPERTKQLNKRYATQTGRNYNSETGVVSAPFSPQTDKTLRRAQENIVEPMMMLEGAGVVGGVAKGAVKQGLKSLAKQIPNQINPQNLNSKSSLDWMKEWYSHPDFERRFNAPLLQDNAAIDPAITEIYQNLIKGRLGKYQPKNYFNLLKDKGVSEYLKFSPTTGGVSYATPESIYVNRTMYVPFDKKGIESVRAHELSHLIDDNGYLLRYQDEKSLLKPFEIFDKSQIPKNPGFFEREFLRNKPEYYLDPTEIHARMNQARFDLGLSPKDKFTEEMFNKITKEKKWYGMNRYIKDKKGFIDLMNNFWAVPPAVAATTAISTEQKQQGGSVESYMGGLTDKGFNYNKAWGGTMQMGGSLPGATGMMYARTGSTPDYEDIYEAGGGIPERYKNMGFSRVGAKKKSTRPGKKWMVLAKKGSQYKVVHGGYKGMQDFTQHGSEKRRKNFWSRMGGKSSSKATDPFSPLYWHKRFGTWESGGFIQPFPQTTEMAQPGITLSAPTTADSARLYNAQMALNAFYDKEIKAGRLKKVDASQINKDFANQLFKDLKQQNLDFYRKEIYRRAKDKRGLYDKEYKEYFNLSPKQVSDLEMKGLGQTKSGTLNQEYYRDLITPMQNLAAPFALVDRRITPQRTVDYVPGKKTENSFVDYPGGNVTVFDYDPLAIKPYHARTPQEKITWERLYGKNPPAKPSPQRQKVGTKTPPVSVKRPPVPATPVKRQAPGLQTVPKTPLASMPIPSIQGQPITVPTLEQPKTQYSYTYPTFNKGVQKTVYFPNEKLWREFAEKEGYTSSSSGKDWGTATGYYNPEFEQGGAINYYQQGLDFQPKTISEAGNTIVQDNMGYWNPANWGRPVQINSNRITMQDVYEPLLGVSNTGDTQMMYPGQEYRFNGSSVVEYPIMEKGGKLANKKASSSKNWLDKYK